MYYYGFAFLYSILMGYATWQFTTSNTILTTAQAYPTTTFLTSTSAFIISTALGIIIGRRT